MFSGFIKPAFKISFLNSLSGIAFSLFIIFWSFSMSFRYLPKYNNFISYIFSFFDFSLFSIGKTISISCKLFISNDENGKNNTSLSVGIHDIFSISACVDKL